MKTELLAKLMPSSLDISTYGSKNHNAITTEDILIKLSYSKLTENEYNFILAKFLNDDSCRSSVYKNLIKEVHEEFGKEGVNHLVCRFVEVAIMECILTRCPFCNGTGFNVFKTTISKCPHCNNGEFIYDDNVRANLIGITLKKFKKERNKYDRVLELLNEIEINALSKIDS